MMSTEKRLIDANALKSKLQEHHDYFVDGWGGFDKMSFATKCRVDEIDNCIAEIVNATTVDAVEVVHGRWEDVFKGNCAWARYKCSVCGGYALYRHEQDIIGKWETVQALTAYCPYCGSYMEEGEMNGNL